MTSIDKYENCHTFQLHETIFLIQVLYEPMPVVYLYAVNTTSGKDPTLYECPIYRKPLRTDSTYIGSIDLETIDYLPSHWTLRGVALLCDIK